MIDAINAYPKDTRFYFSPPLGESQYEEIEWVYVNILCRYFCYPREILYMEQRLYEKDKSEYMRKFIGNVETYQELGWIKERDIRYIIMYYNSRFSILPISARISR